MPYYEPLCAVYVGTATAEIVLYNNPLFMKTNCAFFAACWGAMYVLNCHLELWEPGSYEGE